MRFGIRDMDDAAVDGDPAVLSQYEGGQLVLDDAKVAQAGDEGMPGRRAVTLRLQDVKLEIGKGLDGVRIGSRQKDIPRSAKGDESFSRAEQFLQKDRCPADLFGNLR
jgi:hypothetical protein